MPKELWIKRGGWPGPTLRPGKTHIRYMPHIMFDCDCMEPGVKHSPTTFLHRLRNMRGILLNTPWFHGMYYCKKVKNGE